MSTGGFAPPEWSPCRPNPRLVQNVCNLLTLYTQPLYELRYATVKKTVGIDKRLEVSCVPAFSSNLTLATIMDLLANPPVPALECRARTQSRS